jgi:hypothetical protein
LVRHFADNEVLKIEWDIDAFAPALITDASKQTSEGASICRPRLCTR